MLSEWASCLAQKFLWASQKKDPFICLFLICKLQTRVHAHFYLKIKVVVACYQNSSNLCSDLDAISLLPSVISIL